MEKGVWDALQKPDNIAIAIILYVLSLPFAIRNWKHQNWKEKHFKNYDKYQKGKVKW